jgi:integrase
MLTDAQIKRAKRGASIVRLFDGRGLVYILPPTGQAYWRVDFRLHGRRRSMSLGVYGDVSLAKAREQLRDVRALVAQGIDPVRAREKARTDEAAAGDFVTLAEDWFARKVKALAPNTVKKKRGVLDRYILPGLGRMRVKDIGPADVLRMIRSVEGRGLRDSARTARQITSEIFRYGVATGCAARDVTPDLIGALEPVIVTHRAAVTSPKDAGALMRAIASMHGTPQLRSALRLLAMTFVRPSELRLAEWTEFDLDAATWHVPSTRTKQREGHYVPLSWQAIAELRILEGLCRGSKFILPTPRTILRPMSDAAFVAALSRIGYSTDVMTPHGFRAMARTLLDEQLHESPDVIEAQLAHAARGPLGATYNRSRYLTQRRALMQRWSDYLADMSAIR